LALALALVLFAIWVAFFWIFGIATLVKRRYVFFILGIPFPLLWIPGALLPGRG
jgi:hypothetical protein